MKIKIEIEGALNVNADIPARLADSRIDEIRLTGLGHNSGGMLIKSSLGVTIYRGEWTRTPGLQ